MTPLEVQLTRAIEIATAAHRTQTDKQGMPYILHPLAVMGRVPDLEAKIVATLHDVVEDTAWTLDELRAEGFTEEIVAAVDALSRREGETYSDFIGRTIAGGLLPMRVKLADIAENTRPDRRHPDAEGLGKRYEKAKDRIDRAISAEKAKVSP